MAIRYSRDPQTGDYLAHDTETGIIERYPDQPTWLYASLVRILAMTERVEAGLAALAARPIRASTTTETTAAPSA